MARPESIEIPDDFADLVGSPTAVRLVSRVGSTGDCQTCGTQLGQGAVNLYAQCLVRSPDGVGPWLVTAHHARCQAPEIRRTGAVSINSQIGVTYSAVGMTKDMKGTHPDDWFNRMRNSGSKEVLVMPLLWVCPAIDFFMIDVVGPGNSIDSDLQQFLREADFHNMVDTVPNPSTRRGPKGAAATLTDGRLTLTPPLDWSVTVRPGGPYEQAIHDAGGVLVLVSTWGGLHTPGVLDKNFDSLMGSGEVAGAWVPLRA